MIDPKELMIGDRVRVYKEIGLLQFDVMRIYGIYRDSVSVIDDHGKRFDYTCDHLEPIVFNCGLAMDNGFVATDKHTWSHKDEYGLIDFEFSIYPDVMKEDGSYYLSVAIWGFRNARVNYLHEFQHALRICGLRDMADNLKIDG